MLALAKICITGIWNFGERWRALVLLNTPQLSINKALHLLIINTYGDAKLNLANVSVIYIFVSLASLHFLQALEVKFRSKYYFVDYNLNA